MDPIVEYLSKNYSEQNIKSILDYYEKCYYALEESFKMVPDEKMISFHNITHTDDDGVCANLILEEVVAEMTVAINVNVETIVDTVLYDHSDGDLMNVIETMYDKITTEQQLIDYYQHVVIITDLSVKYSDENKQRLVSLLNKNPSILLIWVDHHVDSQWVSNIPRIRYISDKTDNISTALQMALLFLPILGKTKLDLHALLDLVCSVSGYDTFSVINEQTVSLNTISFLIRKQVSDKPNLKNHLDVLYAVLKNITVEDTLHYLNSVGMFTEDEIGLIYDKYCDAKRIRSGLVEKFLDIDNCKHLLLDKLSYYVYIVRYLDSTSSKYASVAANMALQVLNSRSSARNVICWTSITEDSISFRSLGADYARRFALQLGGGGHDQAAGSSVKEKIDQFTKDYKIEYLHNLKVTLDIDELFAEKILDYARDYSSLDGASVDELLRLFSDESNPSITIYENNIVMKSITKLELEEIFNDMPFLLNNAVVKYSIGNGFRTLQNSVLARKAAVEWVDTCFRVYPISTLINNIISVIDCELTTQAPYALAMVKPELDSLRFKNMFDQLLLTVNIQLVGDADFIIKRVSTLKNIIIHDARHNNMVSDDIERFL